MKSDKVELYHSEKLQSTKTKKRRPLTDKLLYHSEKLQSTKTDTWIGLVL